MGDQVGGWLTSSRRAGRASRPNECALHTGLMSLDEDRYVVVDRFALDHRAHHDLVPARS